MVIAYAEPEQSNLHVMFYETRHGRQGILEFTLNDPSDTTRIQPNDSVELADLHAHPGEPATLTLRHADGAVDRIQARYAGR